MFVKSPQTFYEKSFSVRKKVSGERAKRFHSKVNAFATHPSPEKLSLQSESRPVSSKKVGFVQFTFQTTRGMELMRNHLDHFRLLSVAALASVLVQASISQAACCYFSAKNTDILQPAQKVFITWDPSEKNETFTVQPKFEGNA